MGIFPDNYFDPQFPGPNSQQLPSNPPPSWAATARYSAPPAAAFPNPPASAPAPAPLAIPPAQPPVFLSAPNPTSPQDSIGQSINNGLTNHALTLMALGAGIAQGGVGRGLALAGTAAEAERNRQIQQQSFLQTYNALTDGGVPPEEARAAISNPALMRTLAAKYLGPRSPGSAASAPAAPPTAANSNPSPTPAVAVTGAGPNWQGNASNAPAAAPNAPGVPASFPVLPPNVSKGAAYSATRNMWRDRDGNFFDHQGKAVP
jgi:hypothetical protein